MSSSSDSEDDDQRKRFLEAADSSLNELFQKQELKTEGVNQNSGSKVVVDSCERKGKDAPKSQRYLPEDEINTGVDIDIPETVRQHLSKKLAEIISRQVEFCHTELPKQKKPPKSRIRLVSDADCYVKTYEEFEYDSKGPEKKPEIKRRIVDGEPLTNEEECLKQVAVSGADIAAGDDMKLWAKKRDRKDKIFHYKLASNGVFHAREKPNEFSQLRHKNRWNESKIKRKLKT